MRSLLFLLFLFLSCSRGPFHTFSIGIDPSFTEANLGEKQDYLMGYVEDFFLALSKQSGKDLEKIYVSSRGLLEGLEKQEYQAIFTFLEPYSFYKDKYDFSEGFLQVGMVLVTTEKSPFSSLEKMEGEKIGFLEKDFPYGVFKNLPKKAIVETYSSYPQLLNAVEKQEIEGAVLERLPAISFLQDSFFKKLKLVEKPVVGKELRLVTLKGKNQDLIRYFNGMKTKNKDLLKKWGLL